jgi:hypothetical protein
LGSTHKCFLRSGLMNGRIVGSVVGFGVDGRVTPEWDAITTETITDGSSVVCAIRKSQTGKQEASGVNLKGHNSIEF